MRNQFDATDLDSNYHTNPSLEKQSQNEAIEDLVGRRSVEKKTIWNKKTDKKVEDKQVLKYRDQRNQSK